VPKVILRTKGNNANVQKRVFEEWHTFYLIFSSTAKQSMTWKKIEENKNYEAALVAALRGCLKLRHHDGQIQYSSQSYQSFFFFFSNFCG